MKSNAWYYFYGTSVSQGIIAYYIMPIDNITGFLMNPWMQRQAMWI